MIKLRNLVPAMLAMALALMSTVVAAMMVQREVIRVEQRQFQMEAISVKDAIAGSMRGYALGVSAGAALFQTVGDVSDSQWRDFVASLQLASAYPGYQGLGFAEVVHREEVDELERRHHAEGNTDFHVRPKDGRDLYIPIVKLEPRDWRNKRALGFDMFSEAVRRAAMERARDTGLASLSGKVVLVQETGEDVQPGVLMYLPVYASGPPLSSVQERRQRLRGFAYMAMRMDDLIRAVLQRHTPAALAAFDIALYDGAGPLQDDTRIFHSVNTAASRANDLKFEMSLEVAGRTWTVSVAGSEPLAGVSDSSRPWIVLGAGLIISGLIGAIVGFQAVARASLAHSRQVLADEIVERKKAQEAADMANSELIHRVKNTLAVVSAIASQTSRYSANMQEFNVAFRERLAALGRVQDLVRPGVTAEPDLMALIQQLLNPYVENGKERLIIKGAAVSIPKNDVVLYSLAFNELATNAIKYGAWSNGTGRVLISWNISGESSGQRVIEMTWQEEGSPETVAPAKQGFGTAVLKFAIERAMGGKIILDAGSRGMVYRMQIPYRG